MRFVQFGCGKMSRYLVKYALERGYQLVGAFDISPDLVGQEFFGQAISDAANFGQQLASLKPDFCIIATRSTMAEIADAMTACAEQGVNAITTCEEAIYPWNSSPEITERLDALAKAHGATLTGSGYPDVFWGTLIATLAGSVQKITQITGSSSYNIEDYGIALAEGHGAGLSVAEFEQSLGQFNDLSPQQVADKVKSGEITPSYMWNQNGWLAAKLNLQVVEQTQKCLPITSDKDLDSATLGLKIKTGAVIGMRSIVTTRTVEGITIETENIGKVYAPGEIDTNRWSLKGEPDVSLVVDQPATVELTCATIINRIPQLLSAQPGYQTTNNFPNSQYNVKITKSV
jgi:4-hydroxy-tetrahydrodipicolinate reductase